MLVPGLFEEHPVLAPGMGKADHLKAVADQGVERVDDYESARTFTTGCS
jgi:hypothetical protein